MVCVGHPVNLPAFAKKNGLGNSDDIEVLCKDEKVIDAVHKDLVAVGKKNGLKGMELLESIVLTEDEWTPESGFLTAAQSMLPLFLLNGL
jgi:long-chain acyl-CoA synthetase